MQGRPRAGGGKVRRRMRAIPAFAMDTKTASVNSDPNAKK
jgi:hypothetical protein